MILIANAVITDWWSSVCCSLLDHAQRNTFAKFGRDTSVDVAAARLGFRLLLLARHSVLDVLVFDFAARHRLGRLALLIATTLLYRAGGGRSQSKVAALQITTGVM